MDIGSIITTTITTIGLIIVAILNIKGNAKVDKYHKEVNGKMGQLLEVTKKASKAEGKLEEREERNSEKQGDI